MKLRPSLAILVALLLAGCSGVQSALDPAGPNARSLHALGIVMYVGATVVTLLVTALMLVPFLRRRHAPVRRRLFLWAAALPCHRRRSPGSYPMCCWSAARCERRWRATASASA